MKKTLYIIFLVPLTFLAGLVIYFLSVSLISIFVNNQTPYEMTEEEIERRIENSSCSLQEKEDYRNGICLVDEKGILTDEMFSDQYKGSIGDSECCVSRVILQGHRAGAGAGAFVLLFGSILSVVYIPFFLFYVFKIRKWVFK